MHRDRDGRLTYSPTDLVRHLGSPFASAMDRLALERPGAFERDPEADEDRLVMELGNRHEAAHLERLRQEGRTIVSIDRADRGSRRATETALRAGADVVYQGSLALEPFAGFADFLERVPGASALGAFHYEVVDTKLAADAKPGYLIQLCAYAEMLEKVQGRRPEHVHVVLRGGERRTFRTDDFYYAYLVVKRAFLAQMADFEPDRPLEPDLGGDYGPWSGEAKRRLEAADHLALVAGIRTDHIRRLAAAGVSTMAALAAKPPRHVKGIGDDVVARLHQQARLQVASRGRTTPLFEIVPQGEGVASGLASLPPPSALDVYFDLEGYPLVEGGLEYLFGAATEEHGESEFVDWWAHDDLGERRALEAFVAFVTARRRRDPAMHVYHYAPYEKTALRRLMGRHGVCEAEIDDWLRAGVLVDLYGVVRRGLRVGTPSYSIKALEVLWGRGRAGEVKSGADSIVAYHRFTQSGEPRDWTKSPILAGIRAYNREDCLTTRELAHWLRERQAEAKIEFCASPASSEPAEDTAPESDRARERRALVESLLRSIPGDPAKREPDAEHHRVTELLANLVEFHRREGKPVWWSLFDRLEMAETDRFEDGTCLAGLVREQRPPVSIKRSTGAWYRFPVEQETKARAGSKCRVATEELPACDIAELDTKAGRVLVKFGPKSLAALGGAPPESMTLLLHDHVGAGSIEDSIARTASAWRDGASLPRALMDLLERHPPRVGASPGRPLVAAGEDATAATCRLVLALDRSVLCVQGPPGTGKTYTGARAIAALIAAGRRVGVASNSHRAIVNLLEECARAIGPAFRCVKVGSGDDEDDAAFAARRPGVTLASSADAAAAVHDASLVGGTAWFFSRDDVVDAFDVLFVDEASQVSLANLVGMAPCAKSLVLLGDPMQLPQPTQGVHPGESGRSALDYALAGRATVPPDFGVFLPVTRRLHPRLCSFIGGAFYEDRLTSHESAARRVVRPREADRAAGPESVERALSIEAGLAFVPVPHEGSGQKSDEEVEAVVRAMNRLVGRDVTDERGRAAGALTLDDVVIVAPYNLQVAALAAALPAGARVGSVDLFQGQEARVAIVSLTASDAEAAARGLEFVLDPRRLNVAISRAQSIAVVVASPTLLRTRCRSVAQMRLLNTLCRIAEGEAAPAARS